MKFALSFAMLALLLVASSPYPPKTEVRHGTERHHHASGRTVATPRNQPSSIATPAETRNYTYTYYYPEKSTVPPVPFQILTTVLLLFFTAGLWVTSILQWKAMQENLRIAQRAIVGVIRIDFRLMKKPTVVVVFENYGHMGAKHIRIPARAFVDTEPPDRIDFTAMQLPAVPEISAELMPGVEAGQPLDQTDQVAELGDEVLNAIQNKQMYPYVIGRIFYNDGFEDTQVPLFCYWWDVQFGTMRTAVRAATPKKQSKEKQ
jgi:hypothetical protein